jgi:hypothetical protein
VELTRGARAVHTGCIVGSAPLTANVRRCRCAMHVNPKLGRNYSWALCVSLLVQFISTIPLVYFPPANASVLFLSAFLVYWAGVLGLLLPQWRSESALKLIYVALGFPVCLAVSGFLWHHLG